MKAKEIIKTSLRGHIYWLIKKPSNSEEYPLQVQIGKEHTIIILRNEYGFNDIDSTRFFDIEYSILGYHANNNFQLNDIAKIIDNMKYNLTNIRVFKVKYLEILEDNLWVHLEFN